MVVVASVSEYASIVWLVAIALAMTAFMLIFSHIIGPRRHGQTKDTPYESGMNPTGDARQRFHVRFFLVAMLFLLFDVEVVLLWPWAPLFVDATRAAGAQHAATKWVLDSGMGGGFLLVEAGLFGLVLLLGYVYAWRKGAFKFN